MPHTARSVARVLSSIFIIVMAGATFASLLSDVARLRWTGGLLLLMLIEYAVHFGAAHYSLRDLYAGRVPGNNIALCASRSTLRALLNAVERVEVQRGDFHLALMLALLDRPQIEHAIERLDIRPQEFRDKVREEFEISMKSGIAELAKPQDLLEAAAVQAGEHAHKLGKDDVDAGSFFSAAVHSGGLPVSKVLDYFSIKQEDVDAAVVLGSFVLTKGSIPFEVGGFALSMSRIKSHRTNRTFTSRPTPFIDQFSRDVTEDVRGGLGGFLIGHQAEYDRMIDALSRSASRNVLLVGDPGVGKSAMVDKLAFDIVSDAASGGLYDRRVVKLSLGDFIGSDTGNLAERLQAIAFEIARAGNIVLVIDDAHLLAKTVAQGGIGLADVLLPIIKDGLFPVIGLTTPQDYRQYIDQNATFRTLFEKVQVQEITQQEAIALLSYEALVYEKRYGVIVSFYAVKKAVELAVKYLRFKPLPSSAQDLLHEVIADATQRKERIVKADEVVAIVERKVDVPIHRASASEAKNLLHLEDTIHEHFIDQDEAVKAVSQALRAYRSGLSRKGGPIASFLFVGPTGVGKTELSKLLAMLHFGSDKFMARFDMSEYQQKDSVSRLIGSTDGRIAGLLTEAIISHPYSLILLDELEKAHPDILNLFLQVLDDGRLTDSMGRLIDFQNTIVIATSNAHSVFIQEKIMAGEHISAFSDELKRKLTDFFKPELLNRFSDIIVFKPLDKESLEQIALLNLNALSADLQNTHNIELEITASAVREIARLGYDPQFGARPLRKVIDSRIRAVLAEKILSGELNKGESVSVSLDEQGGLRFAIGNSSITTAA
jgi:ATP-dependent Clp protease ATP-binding subunit ClpC